MLQSIIRMHANRNYRKIIFSSEQPVTVAKVLHWFEDNLSTDYFIRIHKTHLVNRDFVSSVEDKSLIHLSNGDILQISRRRRQLCNKKIAA